MMVTQRFYIRSWLSTVLFCLLLLIGLGYVALQLSPWPMVGIIRYTFGQGAESASLALQKHVPAKIDQQSNLSYLSESSRTKLDVFTPANKTGTLPTIVWIHGGAWVSGDKSDVHNYARVLAGHGFAVVTVGYSIAPEATYPTPVRQVHAALAYLQQNAVRLHIDPDQIILAGDSAGAHIAAQVAASTVDHAYAAAIGVRPVIRGTQLRGLLLYCGPYDIEQVNTEGPFGSFLKTVLWAYSGRKVYLSETGFRTASVLRHVNKAFPPSFISVGNGDPLAPQSLALADMLTKQGVRVDRLFFSENYQPSLGHEYQFNLDSPAGKLALQRSLLFLSSL